MSMEGLENQRRAYGVRQSTAVRAIIDYRLIIGVSNAKTCSLLRCYRVEMYESLNELSVKHAFACLYINLLLLSVCLCRASYLVGQLDVLLAVGLPYCTSSGLFHGQPTGRASAGGPARGGKR